MSELRQDPITKRWVVIANARNNRPVHLKKNAEENKPGVNPFAPGNESLTPPEVFAFRKEGTTSDTLGWWVRVIPNKFAAVSLDVTCDEDLSGFHKKKPAVGSHEVIVETPDEHADIALLPHDHMTDIWRAYRERMQTLFQNPVTEYVQIFRNQGYGGGASLPHPHSQLISLPLVPKNIEEEVYHCGQYAEINGRCLFCDLIVEEQRTKTRIVAENEDFIAFCAYAPRFPFETWIAPKNHAADFSNATENMLTNIAALYQEVLQRLAQVLGKLDYNMVLHTAPRNLKSPLAYHWHVEILPRHVQRAGFEFGSGCYLVTTSPEQAAGWMRESNNPEPA
ncbi:MAG: galactose-1-phosphate uridylyltransferase [Deltaproteobacteria bacterium]|nr:galactose-1-phosphate uridylyltransferase [Deltaproteobacteria bacterium]